MNKGNHSKKRPYKKPQVEQVELVPEEQVLAICKEDINATGLGRGGQGSCTTLIPVQCVDTFGS